ncbi:MAG: leucyl/phenylalanyl-tRNA--protein transferase, partial [Epsilonproteobacteria bacterium]
MNSSPIWLESDNINFPLTNLALTEPDGLLAIGGDLSPQRIVNAYLNGIFPWYSDG